MIVDSTSLQGFHDVFVNTDDISGAGETMTEKAKDEKWRHGSKATDVETGIYYLWDAENEIWVAQNATEGA